MIRESASAGVIWKCWSNISFRLDSAILLSASRRLPLYPKPSARAPGADGGGGGKRGRAAGERGETADRGLKRPIEDLQTRCCHPLSPSLHLISLSLSLCNLLFPSNLPQPRPPTSWLVLLLPRPPPMSLDWSTPDCGSSKMTNCLAKQSGMRNSKNTRLKCWLVATIRTFLRSLPKFTFRFCNFFLYH